MNDEKRLFTLLFPSESSPEEQDLYYRNEDKTVSLADETLHFPAGASLSFDCYFNAFDYAVYRDNTAIDSLEYVLTAQGDLIFKVFLSRSDDEKKSETILLGETSLSSETPSEIRIPIDLASLEEKGYLYLSVSAGSGGTLFGGYLQATNEPLRDVKIGIAITTFKRESFVKKNVAALIRDLPKDTFTVFVTDNGNTLSSEDVAGAYLIPNKNLGGSGGFTRGIMEIEKCEDITHVLLTDDDISFESEIFLRTAALLRYCVDPEHTIIGASMIFLDTPYLQHEFGSRWTGRYVLSQNNKLDLRDPHSLLQNASASTAEYTAWWFNCFPISLPKRIGLPFPFFIKIDDVEYCMRANCKILLLNGIGVWHESFENKYSAVLEYYAKRNELILNALYHPKRAFLSAIKIICRAIAKQLIFQRYFALDLVYKAFDDFLAGAENFAQINPEQLHAALRPLGEKYLTREALEAEGFDCKQPFYTPKSFDSFGGKLTQVLTLNGYLLPAEKGYRVINMITDEQPKYFYRARRVVQYNPITEKGIVTEQKRGMLFRAGFRLIGYFFKMLFKHHRASKSYREHFAEIVSEEAWKKRLDIKE